MASILYLYMCYYRIPNYHLIFTWYIVLCLLKKINLSNYLKACLKTQKQNRIVLNIHEEEE